MKYLSICFILMLVIPILVLAQPIPDTLWTRTYGGSGTDLASSVQLTSDGGYIVAGYTNSFGSGLDDFYLVKTNPLGDTLWTRTFGGSVNDRCYAVQQTTDGGYILGGATVSFGAGDEDFYLVKTNSSGDTLWTRTYGGSGFERAQSVQQTADGGYIVAGRTTSFGAGSNDFYLVKTTSLGDTLWTRTYGGSSDDLANSVQQTADGGYIVAGWTESFGGAGGDCYLVKTNSQGDTLWTRIYGGGLTDWAAHARQTTDGGYIVVGYTESFGAGNYDFYLLKTNSLGDTLWTRTYGGGGSDVGLSVRQTTDGGYILGGYTNSYGAGQSDFWLVKTDENGDSLWTRTYGGGNNDDANSVQQTADGGYILSGFTSSFGAGDDDFYLVKTGPEPLCGPLSGTIGPGEFHVDCDISVESGDTLDILPGTTLLFKGHYKFIVYGNLQAIGTEQDSILLTRAYSTEESKGRGLRFLSQASSMSCLEYCRIEMQHASGSIQENYGGGIYFWDSCPTITHCTICDNVADHHGGGIFCDGLSAPVFTHCSIIRNNVVDESGGGIYCNGGSATSFTHCLIAENTSTSDGGGICISTVITSCDITNCTISRNISSSGAGGGIWFDCAYAVPAMRNCIVWGNAPSNIHTCCSIEYSDIQGGCSGEGNIDADPMFVDTANSDYHLTEGSPCIDAGDPTMFDPDCTPSDMGAFYFFHLAQPDSLIVQQQGNDMFLCWSVVDSTECGFPTPIQSYVIFYEEELSENWDFLAATPDTFFTHENVVLFAPSMFYEIVATDVAIGLICSIAQPGMSRRELEAALRRIQQ